MLGGLAIRKNLLCAAVSDVRGRVFLIDLEERRPAASFEFAEAGGVAIDAAFTLFVADTRKDLLRRFTIFGQELAHFGQPSTASHHARRRDRPGVLTRPHGVAVHAGVVYVCCGDARLVTGVQRFTSAGVALPPLHAFGESGRPFGAPRGICASAAGIFVADTLHGCVQCYTAEGRFVRTFPTATRPGETSRPVAVAPQPGKSLVVVEHGDGPGLKRFSWLGKPLGTLPIAEPLAICSDPAGSLYVLDQDGLRVQRFAPDFSHGTVILDLAEFLHGQ